jgi:hypothetical protein
MARASCTPKPCLLCQVRALLADEFDTLDTLEGEGGGRKVDTEGDASCEPVEDVRLSPGTGK